ncbi:ATP-grasp domain-containing protein [Oscillatoria sp. FACHB-1406]|uniref:ATP-grasp domain-containing protein n=1 Tax=Oscillatoria sp. FACHB-1406 TaxID=2692846 RepID=UPI001687C55D|nr:ATP-grasp domain-containing protein [Oscillatoria sp. FACHB-1406]MBD2578844.1 ATP-grasp domain-containing protein [Oscillatoria sp. FACHB-1406]
MISQVFLQQEKNCQLSPENSSLYRAFHQRGYPITLFAPKQLYRRQLPLKRDCLVAGEIPIVLSALKQLAISPPPLNDYPVALTVFLHRHVWKSSLGSLIDTLEPEGAIQPIFVKPASRRKQFTGKVFSSLNDLWCLGNTSRREEIFCSNVVTFKSEYRAYIIHSQIVGIYHYGGDSEFEIDRAVILEAIQHLDRSKESLAGYSLDFGRLDNGETALVEMNEGFSLGNYGLSDESYADLIIARWEELMKQL